MSGLTTSIEELQTIYLKAVANIGTLRKQLADVSVDSGLHPKVQAGLIARLGREISEESEKAINASEYLLYYMVESR